MAGPILTVSGTASVSIYDLELFDALGVTTGDGIYMPTGTPTVSLHRVTIDHSNRFGLLAAFGTLSIDRSTISQNTGGGLNLANVSFDIKNSFITKNPGSLGFGGIQINQPGAVHSIEFTTIANNNGDAANDANGITCGSFTSVLTFSNNIIYGNAGAAQVFGTKCAYAYSDVGSAVSGATNVNMDPMFKDPANGDFHLMSTSMLKDMADPNASDLFDFDGNPRPQGMHSDMGADEVMP